MAKVIITGWREGLLKISFTHLLREYFHHGLKDAKGIVDRVLEGETITILSENIEIASKFNEEAKIIGVICHVIKE